MIRLSKSQVIKLHAKLIEATGDSQRIRDEKLLDSVLETPFQTFGNVELYLSIQSKADRLCFGVVKNYAMINGNKRLEAHIMLIFLKLNGFELCYTQQELSDIILKVLSGEKMMKICFTGLLSIRYKIL